jgi:two-component system sensor kinase FixL
LLNAFDAMKDCPPGERAVLVKTEPDGAKRVKVSVADHGIGLASDRIDKIFQPFYTTKREGLGMGLSISRSIIEAHGGKLWAENNSDRGATFYFTVPVENEGRVTSFEGHGTREG